MIFRSPPEGFQSRFELVSCFFEHAGKILLLHRHPNKSQGGRWGMPAGKVNEGEELRQAMVREIQEETGCIVSPEQLRYFDKVYVEHPEHSFVYHMFSLELPFLPEVRIEPYEHAEFSWVTPSDALCTNLVQDLDRCIKMFYKNL